ncbi:hypothetical protein [Siphonobacter sp. SORGH_AS_1065]|uniref:hypothetical protein n=1 Tax=Siphonobacter sp. SORGH_AS_1065 TaxID=3041795 RepID=UPI00278B2553|nr:hypothetical protein [Siphonobacter sp. SORGH_AS_1065]MDQ1087889.1 hypothetical protein [Siphonobacter sp. SORGH_AS_1065]
MKPILYLFIFLISTACQRSAIRLNSLTPDTHQEDGLQVARQVGRDLKVVTSFESVYESRQRGAKIEYLIFDTEVTNLSEHPIEIKPSDFEISALDTKKNLLPSFNGYSESWNRKGLDPDQELVRIDQQMRQEQKVLKFNKVFNTVLLIGLVAADVSNQTNTRQSYREFASKSAGIAGGWQTLAIKRVADHQRFANRMDQLSWEKGNFQQETFRRAVLNPGEALRGKLLLESNRDAAYYRIDYPVTSEPISFLFEQKLVKQKRRR